MTLEALQNAIIRLIEKRRAAHGDQKEQDRINEKLARLYELEIIALKQEARKRAV